MMNSRVIPKVMIVLGTLWSAYPIGVVRADSFGFYAEDLPYMLLFWGVLGVPGQIAVAFFVKGSLKERLIKAGISFGIAFVLIHSWLAVEEIIFTVATHDQLGEEISRDRCWPYHLFTMTRANDYYDTGSIYWVL